MLKIQRLLRHNIYRVADKSLAQAGRKQSNVSHGKLWIPFGALPCRKKNWWQLASRCCWNRARPWRASELVSFLAGLRTYQPPGNFYDVTVFVFLVFLSRTLKLKWILNKDDSVLGPPWSWNQRNPLKRPYHTISEHIIMSHRTSFLIKTLW